jgi:hypothetical protein
VMPSWKPVPIWSWTAFLNFPLNASLPFRHNFLRLRPQYAANNTTLIPPSTGKVMPLT